MPKSLTEFAAAARAAKRPPCKICALKPELRAQIAQSDRKVANFATVIAWLKAEHRITITLAELQGHSRSRHDAQDPR